MTLLQLTNSTEFIGGVDAFYKISSKISWILLINLASVLILLKWIYYPIYKHRNLFFTFIIFNLIIFLITFLLNKIELSMGAAFGLFAVFSMLRFKTDDLSLKDMTYLFLAIAIGLISAITKIKDTEDWLENVFLILVNAIIIGITYLLESNIITKQEMSQSLVYENSELIKPEKHEELLLDIFNRTGIKAHRVSIQKIDVTKNAVQLTIYYF